MFRGSVMARFVVSGRIPRMQDEELVLGEVHRLCVGSRAEQFTHLRNWHKGKYGPRFLYLPYRCVHTFFSPAAPVVHALLATTSLGEASIRRWDQRPKRLLSLP